MNLDDLKRILKTYLPADEVERQMAQAGTFTFFRLTETDQQKRLAETRAKGEQCYRDLTRSHPGILLTLETRCTRGDSPQHISDWINACEGSELRRKLRYASYYIRHSDPNNDDDDDGGVYAAQ